MKAGGYLYPDKEHLFFFVFALELPEGTRLPPARRDAPVSPTGAAGHPGKSGAALGGAPVRDNRSFGAGWTAAAEVVALNLCLHNYTELSGQLLALTGRKARNAQDGHAIEQLATDGPARAGCRKAASAAHGSGGLAVPGVLLGAASAVRRVGVDGARDMLEVIKTDSAKPSR